MSVTGYIEEIGNINKEISRLLKSLKSLRNRKKEVEDTLKNYIVKKEVPGIKYKGKTITTGQKDIREKRKKQDKIFDAEDILSRRGVHNAQDVLKEIMETMRGPKTSTTFLKYKKI